MLFRLGEFHITRSLQMVNYMQRFTIIKVMKLLHHEHS